MFLPVELPTGDYYGGHRPGNDLFGESLVALDLKTGQRKWHFQLVHHGIWDMDIPCAPILMDLIVDGRPIKAIGQPTKQGWIYVFDRITGKPVWPIEERPVEKGTVPGEWYSPTQPFVTKPPPFERQGVAIDDLIDFTPALREEAVKLVVALQDRSDLHAAGRQQVGGPARDADAAQRDGRRELAGRRVRSGNEDVLHLHEHAADAARPRQARRRRDRISTGCRARRAIPTRRPARPPASTASGATTTRATARRRPRRRADHHRGRRAGACRWRRRRGGGEGGGNITVQGLPLIKPPYGRITALDMNKGTLAWQIAHGDTPDNIKNHPALKGLTIPRTGRQGRIGVLVTKTLAIAGEGGFATTPTGQRGAMLRAYDKMTGQDVGAVYMPAPQTGSPMTYLHNGKQYLVLAISGAGYSG